MLIFLLAFEISSVISYISLNLSRSSGDLISMISSIFPVRISLNPATSSPVQMLARITGFICSRSYVFFTIFFLNNPMLPPPSPNIFGNKINFLIPRTFFRINRKYKHQRIQRISWILNINNICISHMKQFFTNPCN